MAAAHGNESIRFEPDEQPPPPLAIGAGFQAALIMLAPVILGVVIVLQIAGQPAEYTAWAVFAALLVSGATTILQAVRFRRIGSGHVLFMGTSGAFIAVCIGALVTGGPAMMASLIVISSLFQFLLASRLALLRRIFTPMVTGTVIMLIAVTVVPLLFDELKDVPEGAPEAAAPVAALATLATVAGAGVARSARVAAVVAVDRHFGGVLGIRALRDIRPCTGAGRGLGRHSAGRVAGI